MKVRNLKSLSLSVFVFTLACERIFIESIALKVDVLHDRKIYTCRRILVSFSPDILQAGAVKGLIGTRGDQSEVGFHFVRCCFLKKIRK